MSPLRPLALLLAGLTTVPVLAPPADAAGQLDLPSRMKKAREKQEQSGGGRGDLVLPRRTRKAAEPGESAEAPAEAAGGDQSPAVAAGSGAETVQASNLIGQLAAAERYDAEQVATLAAQLEVLGEAGLRAARAALQLEETSTLVASTRVLLRGGEIADRQAVRIRLGGRLPGGAPVPMLEAISAVDPTFLDDATLVELLGHRQGGMRSAAERQLSERSRSALLPSLMPALRGDRVDTRVRALDLVSGVEDDAVLPLLMDRLDDESPQVASRAAELLAEHPSATVEDELLTRFRASSILFRDGIYALLALVEREDRIGAGILTDDDIPQLLDNLQGLDPFGRSAAAVALAGIGFRSDRREATGWVDLEVPHQLVATVIGDAFHVDFSSIQRPARRRLALLTGERFGADGPAWAQWWSRNATEFRARRATIVVEPGQEGTVAVAFRGSAVDPEAFVLVGPEATEPNAVLGEVLYIGPEEALAMVRLLEREGVFGRDRLPGQYGSGGTLRTLEVEVAGQLKRFSFAGTGDQNWFESIVGLAREVRDRNRWQRYYDPQRHATRREFWLAERPWWLEARSAEEQDRRMAELVLQALAGARSGERDRLVGELEELTADGAQLVATDFATLRQILRKELIYGPRAARLVALAHEAARGGAEQMDLQLGRELFDELYELFRETAAEGLRRTVGASSVDLARELAGDSRALARAVSAGRLAASAEALDLALLRALMDDDQHLVQAAAVEAAGAAGLEELRTEVLVRARIAPPAVRTAALRAAGELGGEGARDAMMAALGAEDAALQRAAVEGLAALGDPATAALLTSFVRRGPGTPHYAPAREGLLALGRESWPELRQLARSDRLGSRREAGLLLAEQGAPEAAPTLIDVLLTDPDDDRVALELAILTCVDMRGDGEPGRAWAAWWERAVQDDSLAWLRGAQERAGIGASPIGSLEDEGTLEGALSLIATLAADDLLLVERARRELSRILGRDVEKAPNPELQAEWRDLLRAETVRHFG